MRSANGAWQDTVNGYPGGLARRSAHPSACTPGAIVPFTPIGQIYVGLSFGRQVYCSNISSVCARTGSPAGNSAVFGVQRTRLLQPRFDAYLPGARLYLTDYDKPTFQTGSITLTGWVKTGTGTVTANATDTGLGVKKITITAPALSGTTAQTKSTESTCSGDRNDRCPATWNTAKPKLAATLNYNVDQLPEGVNTFTATATDIVDNTSTANTTAIPPVRVDRSAPTNLTATGPLVDDEDRYFNGIEPVAVTVAASDPAASNGQQLSGIKTIRIEEVGGSVLATRSYECTEPQGRCPNTANETLQADLSALSEGAHQIRAVATDQAGNAAVTDTFEVLVDRTAPTTPTSFDTDFDTDESIASASWDSSDPDLSDGRPGSDIREFRVRYEFNGTTREVVSSIPSVDLPGVPVGATVSISIVAIDQVGRASTPLSQTVVIAAQTGCIADRPMDDPVVAGLLPGTPTSPADMFVLEQPIAPSALLARLPASAVLVSVLERSPNPSDEYTSGTLIGVGASAPQVLQDWETGLQQDMDEELAELAAARDDLPDASYRAQIDRQIAQLTRRKAQHQAANGVPIRAFAVVHNDAVSADIQREFGDGLSRGAAVSPDTDCDSTSSMTAAAPAQRAAARSSARLTQPSEVADYSPNSFSPPYVRVRTQSLSDRHKVTVAWKYTSVSNLRYWKSKYRRTGTQRGTEIQVNMDRDNGGDPFGRPWWYQRWSDPGPAPIRDNDKNPQWNANFRCAYPDDYFEDDPDQLGLTVGMGCRPNQIFKRYRWSHVVSEREDHDQINVSVQPVHYAKSDHLGKHLPVLGDVSEETYCEYRFKLPGSCYFTDHGPAERLYKLQNSAYATTPGNVVFRRKPLP